MNVLMLFWSSLAEVWRKEKTFSFLFLITILFVFFYSFTQVDLSLTLSRASFITTLQRSFQYIGYFNRPLSTVLFFQYAYPYEWYVFTAYSQNSLIKADQEKYLGTIYIHVSCFFFIVQRVLS